VDEWNAGDTGCARFVVELRARMSRVAPGQCLRITARSEGAIADLPAWCRMTGHELVSAEPPVFVVRRKGGEARGR
jgi:tRNA 2-thiouridine synthesizing protein A